MKEQHHISANPTKYEEIGETIWVNGKKYQLVEEECCTDDICLNDEAVAQDWIDSIMGNDGYVITENGDVRVEKNKGCVNFGNLWSKRSIAQDRSFQIIAQNLLLQASILCWELNDWDESHVFAITLGEDKKPAVQAFPLSEEHGHIGLVYFKQRQHAEEALCHLKTLGLASSLVLRFLDYHS